MGEFHSGSNAQGQVRPALAVFGLGYVGTVSAACFAARGHRVVGVDVSTEKVRLINEGRTPVIEEGIGEVVEQAVADGALSATTDAGAAVLATDVALVCVGTPSDRHGGLSTKQLEAVCEQIGSHLPERDGRRYTVIIRSTMLPGTCEGLVIPTLERASGLRAGTDFGVSVNPEFLREGTSVRDFNEPPKTVVGEIDAETGDVVAGLYEGLPGPVHRVPVRIAEMTKYVDNSFHALKVTFANEIGTICKEIDLDSHLVMDIFRADTKLNISPSYLRPGFAFGGSCLPKDVRALLHHARGRHVELPLLESILPSNELQIERVFEMVEASGATKIGMFGLAFKAGTDDLRESPLVALAERLVGRGFELSIRDDEVSIAALRGGNRAYIDARLPHLSRLLVPTAAEVVSRSQLCILAKVDGEVVAALGDAPGVSVIDLVRTDACAVVDRSDYTGVAW